MAEGKENLIPCNLRSKEEASELGRKGGIESGKTRRKKRLMKDLVIEMLNSKIWNDELKTKILNVFPEMEDEKMQVQTAMIASQIQKAMKGDTKAFEVMRDTAGQKPVEQQVIGFDETNKLVIDLDDEDGADDNNDEFDTEDN